MIFIIAGLLWPGVVLWSVLGAVLLAALVITGVIRAGDRRVGVPTLKID